MNARNLSTCCLALMGAIILGPKAPAQVCNLRVITDASPDTTDLASFLRSTTGAYSTIEEKCWALFHWVHIGRRQTSPMIMHGVEVTDPIRQFNDFGYAMCSTVAGMNCVLWHHLGLPVRFWDVTLHTVSECFYGGRWHMYDNSMSAVYTLCDGRTIAGVEDLAKTLGCPASGGRKEPGHIVKYHCLTATSPNGFLTGADCARELARQAYCFQPSGLKLRTYYNNWDWGHRYILNIREAESYTRFYHSLGDDREFFVPNQGKDPESVNPRYRIRGNGLWKFTPRLSPENLSRLAHSWQNIVVDERGNIRPALPAVPGEIVFKFTTANIATSQLVTARVFRRSTAEKVEIFVSTTAGTEWQRVYEASATGNFPLSLSIVDEVNGSYQVLVKFVLYAPTDAEAVSLGELAFETRTMLNSKLQPHLRLGRNTVYVDAGPPWETMVIWPDLRGDRYRRFVVAEENIATLPEASGWHGVMFAKEANKEAFTVYRVQIPRPIRRVVYGGRFYNRAPGGEIRLLHSFDGGKTWQCAYRLTETEQPWDDIHYVDTTEIPPGVTEVLFKYALQASQAGPTACSIYGVYMEVQYDAAEPTLRPLDVVFTWEEIGPDRTRVLRSHRQRVERVPFRYFIDVGGVDHPVVKSLAVSAADPQGTNRYGYSDEHSGISHPLVDFWEERGKNILEGKRYTLSAEPNGAWGGDDPERRKLTDGVVGPNYAGGTAMQYAAGFDPKMGHVDITVDIGQEELIRALGIHLTAGWPWWDALRGEVQDEVEAFLSCDGTEFESCGKFRLNLFRRDIPVNHMLPDDETAQGWNYILPLAEPRSARYVRFRVTPRRIVGVTEVQAFTHFERKPFRLRILLPDETPEEIRSGQVTVE